MKLIISPTEHQATWPLCLDLQPAPATKVRVPPTGWVAYLPEASSGLAMSGPPVGVKAPGLAPGGCLAPGSQRQAATLPPSGWWRLARWPKVHQPSGDIAGSGSRNSWHEVRPSRAISQYRRRIAPPPHLRRHSPPTSSRVPALAQLSPPDQSETC